MSTQLKRLTITPEMSIRDAMIAIDQGACEISLVVDDQNHLLGTITDGDVRRALLKGKTLEDHVSTLMNRKFSSVSQDASRNNVIDLMRARTLSQIPVVDNEGRLVGLHLLRELIGTHGRSNWAVIMAGGRGERLRPLTDSIPKPMIRVAGRPILERIILHLIGYGITRIFLSVNYMAEIIENHFKDGMQLGCAITYLRETIPLGTGGALSLLPERPDKPILVLNGDLLTQFNVSELFAFHERHQFKATIGIYDYLHTVPYGVVDINEHVIEGIREKPTQIWSVNAGIYVFEPDLLQRIPKDTVFPLPALIEECLERKESVGAFHIGDEWMDIGRHQELKKARGGSGSA